jgi:hypothetical protein
VSVADAKPSALEAFSAVMADVQAISKGEYNKDQRFHFRGIDTVMDTVGPVLREHGVVILPTAEDIQLERYQTAKGSLMQGAVVRMRYTVFGPAGDSFSGVTFGQASDSGDKAVSKAQSVAYRVFLLQGLTIPTNEPDPDASSHERSAERAPNPADAARADLLTLCDELGIDPQQAVRDFASDTDGLDIRSTTDAEAIRALAERYRSEHAAQQDAELAAIAHE